MNIGHFIMPRYLNNTGGDACMHSGDRITGFNTPRRLDTYFQFVSQSFNEEGHAR